MPKNSVVGWAGVGGMGQGFLVEELNQIEGQLTTGNPGIPPHPPMRSYNEPLPQKLLNTMSGQSREIGVCCCLGASVQ